MITAFGQLRQEDLEFQANLGSIWRSYLKEPKDKDNNRKERISKFKFDAKETENMVAWLLCFLRDMPSENEHSGGRASSQAQEECSWLPCQSGSSQSSVTPAPGN